MRGITNAPQGGGSSGGEWTNHTTADWSDIFEVSGINMKSKYDIWIYYNSTPFCGEIFIPKETNFGVIRIPVSGSMFNNNLLFVGDHLEIRSSNIPASSPSIDSVNKTYAFAVSGSDVTVTESTSAGTVNKITGLTVKYK